MKLWWHKFTHWEYWSATILYLPTFFYWIWMMIKFRTFSFYKYANPSFKNGGLYDDSKIDIYKLLPQNLYPKTVLIKKNEENNFEKIISKENLNFPLILKPDIGLRGIDVLIVNSIREIIAYKNNIEKDFLIQEFINFSFEMGLFYVRIPNENRGKIMSITLKKFLTIEGNGKETIEQLLRKNPRFEMQILKIKNKINLNKVLQEGEKQCLVPYGNHNRGTEFLDGKQFITEKLERTFTQILDTINGFYYGRLDIRYNSFEELEHGNNFSIIEINGAKSEPTHIYDTKYTFWFGQREIFNYQKMIHKIVKVNIQNTKPVI